MKKYILILIAALTSNSFYAQTTFDKYNGQDDITAIVVNKKMFELMSKVKVDASDKETQQYMSLIKKLDNLRVFTTTNSSKASDMKSTAEKYVKAAGLDQLMQINDGGKNVKISVKSAGNDSQIQELVMFIEGANRTNETVLMSLTGNFNLSELSVLTDKMKIPGGEDLKKLSKKTN